MKTEQIEVPHFEGFECVGVCLPDKETHYVLNKDGSKLVLCTAYSPDVQICYKKIKPITITLMHIPLGIAQEGDYTEGYDGTLGIALCPGEQYRNLWRPI